MKKNLFRIGVLAAMAVAFIGCSKNEEITPESKGRTVTVTFSKDTDTKTAVVDDGGSTVSYVWTNDSKDCFHVYENGVAGTVNSVAYADNKATLSVTFSGSTTANEYVYTAVFAKTITGNKAEIASTQSPAANSFDPEVDVMVSEPITSSTPLTSETPLKFVLHRKVSVNKMTLKGMDPGETVEKVEVTFSKSVGGYYIWANDTYDASSSSKTLTFNYSGATVASDGTFPVFFVINPVESVAFEQVSVTTNRNYYNKDNTYAVNPFAGKTINLVCGKYTKFNMNLFGFASSYTLTPVQGSSSSLTGTDELKIGGITWSVEGKTNETLWQFGIIGKNVTISRTIFSKTAMPFNVKKVTLSHINSELKHADIATVQLIVAANKDFSEERKSLTENITDSVVFKNNDDNNSWENCYFKIIYTIHIKGNHTQYAAFSGATFTEEE